MYLDFNFVITLILLFHLILSKNELKQTFIFFQDNIYVNMILTFLKLNQLFILPQTKMLLKIKMVNSFFLFLLLIFY
jgi:hypothetical protein